MGKKYTLQLFKACNQDTESRYGFLFIPVMALLLALTPISCIQEQDCPTLSNNYFPNETGYWWIYDRFDSLAMVHTKLKVEITGDTVYRDGTAYKVWIFGENNINDTLFVRQNADSALFYRYLDGFPETIMIIPLVSGKVWQHPVWARDTTRVMPAESISVGEEVFTNAFPVQRKLFAFNDYLTETRWFIPNLGLAKLENWHYLFGWISKENWYLQSYSVR